MKQKAILVIALLALVSMMITPVCAETLTGTLISSVWDSDNYPANYGGTPYTISPNLLQMNPIQDYDNLISLVASQTGSFWGFDANAPVSAQTSFIAKNATGGYMGAGTMGYMRIYNTATPAVEQYGGYLWLLFDDFDIQNKVGSHKITIEYTPSALYNISFYGGNLGVIPLQFVDAVGHGLPGAYTINRATLFNAFYSATKPLGIGIVGYVTKTENGRMFIINATSGNVIASESDATKNRFNFSVAAETIIIAGLDVGNAWHNSSVLFTVAGPTPTPTVTPTPAPTIPPGYVRNNLYIWDQNDAQISGADVDVRDVEAGTWTNTSADADGWITIDTLPYHTVNVYAHYPTSNIYLPNEILGLETGYYGGHNWVLVLYPYVTTPSGFVTLYINTRNYDTKAVLTGVNLQIKNLVTGATSALSTGSSDSVSTVVTNATNYQITGSKSGYLSKTIVINSGEASSKTVVIELSKATVTPTVTGTILPGETTVRPTQDPNDPALYGGDTSFKAQEMMNWLAMNGMMLVQFCFLMTIFALLGVKLGKR